MDENSHAPKRLKVYVTGSQRVYFRGKHEGKQGREDKDMIDTFLKRIKSKGIC